MDRDREYARLVRESGLVPVERVRAALRRVGLMNQRGLDADLLSDLVLHGELGEDDAAHLRAQLETEKKKKVITKKFNVSDGPPGKSSARTSPARAGGSSSKRKAAGGSSSKRRSAPSSRRQRVGGASSRRRPTTAGMGPHTAVVALADNELETLKEQARILHFARLVPAEVLRDAFRAVLHARRAGTLTDVLRWLVNEGRITPAHERAVRLKIYRDSGQTGAPPRSLLAPLPLPERVKPAPPPQATKPAPDPDPARPRINAWTPQPEPPPVADALPADPAVPTAPTSPAAPAPATAPTGSPSFGALRLEGLLDDPSDTPQLVQRPASFPPGDAHPIVGDDMSEDDADEETQPSASAEFAFSVIRAAEGEGAAPAVEPGKGKPPTSRLPTTESSSQMRIPAMLFTATRDRALGLLLTESAVIKSWQLDEAESRVATAIAHGTDTNLARMLVELGYLTWEDLGPYLERLYGEETESVILPTFSPDGIAKDISERLPGASSSSASGVRLPVPGQLARPRTSQVMRSQLPPPAPAAPPQKLPASAVQVPPPSGPAVAPLPGDLPSIRARLRDRQSSPGESPVSAPAPPVGGPKVVQQRDLTPRVPEKKKKKKSARQPVQPRQQRAPKHTLQVQEVPALPPHLGGDAGGGRPRGFATPDDQPVGELTGRVGEDRFSVTGALGFSAGGIDLRDAADLAADEAALRRLQDAGLTTPGSLLDDPARLADNRAKYVRLDEIARGGMGAIVRARDRDTRRDVAMKILEDGHDRDKMHRFLEEVQITGQLEHPNIVPVHDVGLDRFGRLFFTMKLVRGESLSAILQQIARRDERGAPPYKDYTLNRLVDLFMRVCDAIAFAHSRGVIHRDLKPENILVGEYGEALVMDWGVAKVLKRKQTDQLAPPPGAPGSRSSRRAGAGSRGMKYGAEPVERRTRVVSDRSEDSALQSQLGDITGTPSYMPPEQARGEVHRLDERTDIYSLGAVLYEILTLHAPFEAESIFVILKDVLEKEPVPPSQRAPKRFIPHELESIVLRAMSKEPEHRYANVPSLQRDIQAWLDGKRVETVDYTALQVLMHWARRHSAAVGVMMFLAIALMLVGGFVWNSLLDERSSAVAAAARERSRADALERRAARALNDQEAAQAARDDARRQLAAAEYEKSARMAGRASVLMQAQRHAEAAAAWFAAGDADPWWYALGANAARFAPRVTEHDAPGRLLAADLRADRLLLLLDDGNPAIVDADTMDVLSRTRRLQDELHAFDGDHARGVINAAFTHYIVPARDRAEANKWLLLDFNLEDNLSFRRLLLGAEPVDVRLEPGTGAMIVLQLLAGHESSTAVQRWRVIRIPATDPTATTLLDQEWPVAQRVRLLATGRDCAVLQVEGPGTPTTVMQLRTDRDPRELRTVLTGEPTAVATDSDGSRCVIATRQSLTDVFGSMQWPLPDGATIRQLILPPDADDPRLLAVTGDGRLVEYDVNAPAVTGVTPITSRPVDGIACNFHALYVGATGCVLRLTARAPTRALIRADNDQLVLAVHPTRPLIAALTRGRQGLQLIEPDFAGEQLRVREVMLPLPPEPFSAHQISMCFLAGRDELLIRTADTLWRVRIPAERAEGITLVGTSQLPAGSCGPIVVPDDQWHYWLLEPPQRMQRVPLEEGRQPLAVGLSEAIDGPLVWHTTRVTPDRAMLIQSDGRTLMMAPTGDGVRVTRVEDSWPVHVDRTTSPARPDLLAHRLADGSFAIVRPTDADHQLAHASADPHGAPLIAFAGSSSTVPLLVTAVGRELLFQPDPLGAGIREHPPERLQLLPAAVVWICASSDGQHLVARTADGAVFGISLAAILRR